MPLKGALQKIYFFEIYFLGSTPYPRRNSELYCASRLLKNLEHLYTAIVDQSMSKLIIHTFANVTEIY